jgi:hypothetical protein
MRNPLSKALWSLGIVMLSALSVLLADIFHLRIGSTTAAAIAIVGITLAIICVGTFIWALSSAIGYGRLMSGKNVIARWHVGAGDWDRFRTFDKIRAAEHLSLRNDMRIRKRTPLQGVDIIVGRHSIIVDGSYHHISAKSLDGRQINWINAPADPQCIEFPKSYPRSKGGSVDLTLRVPVPASARTEGVKAFEFFFSSLRK